jgi:CRP-like cAMP-binding protein
MDLLEVFKDSEDLVEFAAGAVILKEGEAGNHMYVVMEGELSILIGNKVIAHASPGEIVGEMALINSETRSATVVADTDCVLAEIDRGSFDSLLKYVPDFTLHVMNVLAGRLSSAYEMID